ncbi:MAG TPA: hypothetical protein VIL24_04480 [Clostridia bacterium]
MKRPIEKALIILNSIIGLIFVGSVIISKIPLLRLNILDKYLNYTFLKGWLLISAFALAGVYLILSVVLIVNRPKYTNNSIYVYGEGNVKVTSRNIKKLAKAVVNETEGVKSSRIDIELGEFGNCLTVHMKIEDGYDFQSLVAKLRPRLEEAIVEYLGIKFPSYKFADGNVLFEFGAPYSGVGIDLDTSYQREKKPILESEEEKPIEKVRQEPYDNSAKKVIGDEVYPDVDFVPEKIDAIEDKAVVNEEPQLEPDQYSIPYAAPNRKVGLHTEEPLDVKSAPNYKPFEQEPEQPKQAPFQSAYENINREIQKQSFAATNPFEAKEAARPQPQPQVVRTQPNIQKPAPNFDQQARVAPQTGQPAFRRPYPQRPIGVRPTPQSSNTAINPNNPNPQGARPAQTQRPSASRISKEDIYARINAILNKYSNLDDDNNK